MKKLSLLAVALMLFVVTGCSESEKNRRMEREYQGDLMIKAQ